MYVLVLSFVESSSTFTSTPLLLLLNIHPNVHDHCSVRPCDAPDDAVKDEFGSVSESLAREDADNCDNFFAKGVVLFILVDDAVTAAACAACENRFTLGFRMASIAAIWIQTRVAPPLACSDDEDDVIAVVIMGMGSGMFLSLCLCPTRDREQAG
jgi:hypothetical protein